MPKIDSLKVRKPLQFLVGFEGGLIGGAMAAAFSYFQFDQINLDLKSFENNLFHMLSQLYHHWVSRWISLVASCET